MVESLAVDGETTIDYRYDYDHAERLINTISRINNGTEFLMSSNTYDELSRHKTVKEYNRNDFLSTYAYNIRSWTTGIYSSHFNENLTYNYDGNIATKG